MPPTAIEIKGQLDKAVDKEGNVLNMEAVLEIVTTLEKITITAEALETTRIGLVINLMRKKTKNDNLSRRAKNLVKKWQKLANKHLKIAPPNKNGLTKSTNVDKQSINEKFKDNIKAQKRKAPTDSINSNTKRIYSPVVKSRLQANQSPSRIISSPQLQKSEHRSSPKLKGSVSKHSLSSNLKQTTSPDNVSSSIPPKINLTTSSELIRTELDASSITIEPVVNERLSVKPESSSSMDKETKIYNNGYTAHTKLNNDSEIEKAEDTRIQENRIESTTDSQTINFSENTNKNKVISNITSPITSSSQEEPFDIEPENLKIVRKDLPDDIVDPSTQADGVNGVYNEAGTWSEWTDIVMQRNNEIHLLPYVTLD